MSTTAKFTPTKEMIETANNLVLAMAWTNTIRPTVEAYQLKILKIMQPKHKRTGEIITDPKHSYLMSDEDFLIYLERINEERKKADLNVENDEQCPLLVAEDLERKAKRMFCDAMAVITKLNTDTALCSKNGLENYEKLVDLSLRLMIPFVTVKM